MKFSRNASFHFTHFVITHKKSIHSVKKIRTKSPNFCITITTPSMHLNGILVRIVWLLKYTRKSKSVVKKETRQDFFFFTIIIDAIKILRYSVNKSGYACQYVEKFSSCSFKFDVSIIIFSFRNLNFIFNTGCLCNNDIFIQ